MQILMFSALFSLQLLLFYRNKYCAYSKFAFKESCNYITERSNCKVLYEVFEENLSPIFSCVNYHYHVMGLFNSSPSMPLVMLSNKKYFIKHTFNACVLPWTSPLGGAAGLNSHTVPAVIMLVET